MGGQQETRGLLLLAALGLLLVAAGCLGGSGADEEALNDTSADDGTAFDDATDANATDGAGMSFEGPTAEASFTETGTFTTGDGAFVGGAARGADTREHDLTQDVPANAPVTINVTITYSGETTQLNGEWAFDGVEVFDTNYVKDLDLDTIWMEASLARTGTGGSIVAIVQADSSGESAEREYTVETTITSHGEATLPGVPTSVPVTEDSGGFSLEAGQTGQTPPVAVWGPDGSMERLQPSAGSVSLSVEDEDQLGRYVVLPLLAEETEGVASAPLTVRAINASSAPTSPLEIVPIETKEGTWESLAQGEPTEWTFEQDEAPVQAGMRLRTTDPVASTGPGSVDVALAGPAGPLIEESVAGTYVGGAEFVWFTGIAQPELVEGTYEATASQGAGGTSWEATHVVRTLQLP